MGIITVTFVHELGIITVTFVHELGIITVTFVQKWGIICPKKIHLLYLWLKFNDMYIERLIDKYLKEWAARNDHKPLLLRGARQVGKSSAVRRLGESFTNFVEIDFEKHPEYCEIFATNRDVRRIVTQLSAMTGKSITSGQTLLFFDEIQQCPEAIMALRYFKEDMPAQHVIAAGSLLEFALDELPTFGVARIHSMFMYPLTFDEFLGAIGAQGLITERNRCSASSPMPEPLHQRLCEEFRNYMLIGGMPEVVANWVESRDFLRCQEIQDDIILGYEADFPKYRKRVNPDLLRLVFRSAANQATKKFVYANVGSDFKAREIEGALNLLFKAGLLYSVVRTPANGIPLGEGVKSTFRKVLVMDPGLMLRLQNLTFDNAQQIATEILTLSDIDLVNKGPLAEMIAGLEMIRYKTPNIRRELYYWTRQSKGSEAEVDYVTVESGQILPVEVKSGRQGGMKSLWSFMREKHIGKSVRMSLENFSEFTYVDAESDDALRQVTVLPLYAVSTMFGS